MTKILTLQDLHINPQWIDESEKDIDYICKLAKIEDVKCICIAGDFFDKAVMATDKNQWNRILNIARKLQATAPVYFIYGTPSHDVPGCYDSFIDIGWTQINLGSHEILDDIVICGIPEITPAFLNAKFPDLSKEECIQKQYELINKIIDEYYVPIRQLHHDKYLHFMCHGHVQGVKFREDQKPRTTDFMYSEQMLDKISANYYQFGHIHLPQEFKHIFGGYGGGLHLTYKDLDYVPGFNIVEYSNTADSFERHYLSKPMFQKLTIESIEDLTRLDESYMYCNLWIDIKCDKEFAKNFDTESEFLKLKYKFKLADKSKMTLSIEREENVRIDKAVYDTLSLESLYKIYNKDVSENVLSKLKFAQNECLESENIEQKNIELLSVYLKGSKVGLENGVEEINLDFNSFQTGANLIIGKNGQGKSFLLGFCSPFSIHLPTGCDLKSLFALKDSQLIRNFKVNNDIITQKIVIDALKKTPTAKYYMSINETPVGTVTGNKAFFDRAITDMFGSVRMFLASTFRGQKTNKDYPYLEDAKEGDLRKIFTELSGIDRTPLKDFAHEKVKVLQNEISHSASKIEGLKQSLKDKEFLESTQYQQEQRLKLLHGKLENSYRLLENLDKEESKYQEILNYNNDLLNKIEQLDVNKKSLDSQIIFTDKNQIADKERELKLLVIADEEYNRFTEKYNKLGVEYNERLEKWNHTVEHINEGLGNIKNKGMKERIILNDNKFRIKDNNDRITTFENLIQTLNIPCEYCGKLSSDNDERITGLQNSINEFKENNKVLENVVSESDKKITGLTDCYNTTKKTIPQKPDKDEFLFQKFPPIVNKIDITNLQELLTTLKNAEANNKLLVHQISEVDKQIKAEQLLVKDYNSDEHNDIINKVQMKSKEIDQLNIDIATTKKDIDYINNEISANDLLVNKINDLEKNNKDKLLDIEDWKEIEKAFSPKGIPALELSLIAPQINNLTNELLEKYNSRYQVEIITQDLDSNNNIAEKFKILVHDNRSDEVKNLPILSGGQSVWVTRALQESISKISTLKSGIKYLYSIIDEVDGALDSIDIENFYNMINQALDGNKKLISVSHNISAKESVQNVTNVTEFYIDFGG